VKKKTAFKRNLVEEGLVEKRNLAFWSCLAGLFLHCKRVWALGDAPSVHTIVVGGGEHVGGCRHGRMTSVWWCITKCEGGGRTIRTVGECGHGHGHVRWRGSAVGVVVDVCM
jgi:hypothetical protein